MVNYLYLVSIIIIYFQETCFLIMHLLKVIRGLDLFGYAIELNFDTSFQQGSTHRTVFGGFISFFIRCLMTFYIYLLVKKFIFFEGDSTDSTNMTNDLEKLGQVNLNETGAMPLLILFDKPFSRPIDYKESQKYVRYIARNKHLHGFDET